METRPVRRKNNSSQYHEISVEDRALDCNLELIVVSSAKRWSMRRTVLRLKLKNFSDRILCSSLVSMAPLPSTSALLNRSIISGSVPGGKRASYSYRDTPDP